MNKENKGLMSAFKVWLSSFEATGTEMKFEIVTLDDKVTKIEADSFEAGQAVMIVVEDGENVAMPVGEFLLEDGQLLIVKEEGIIDSIGAPEEVEEKPEVEQEGEVAQADGATSSPVAKKIVEAITKETHFSKEDVSLITDRVNVMLSESEITDPSNDPSEEKLEDGESAEGGESTDETPITDPEVDYTKGGVKLSKEEGTPTGLVDAPKQDEVNFSVGGSSLMDLLNR